MSVTSVIPVSSSIVATGDLITVTLSIGDALTSVSHTRTGTTNTTETVYSAALGGFQTGFTGTVSGTPGTTETVIAFRRDAGWDSSPFRIDIASTDGVHSVNYRIQAQGQYPPNMTPYNEPIDGGATVEKLDDIGDVAAANPDESDVLGWDDGAGAWTPRSPQSPGPHILSSHLDVLTDAPAPRNVLTWDGSSWGPGGVTVENDAHGIGGWAFGNETIGATTTNGTFDVNNQSTVFVTEIQFSKLDLGSVDHEAVFDLIVPGSILIFREPRKEYNLAEFKVLSKSGTTYPKFGVEFKSGTIGFQFTMADVGWTLFPVTAGGASASVPTLAQVVEGGSADNTVTPPSGAPIVVLGGTADVPVSITRQGGGNSVLLQLNGGQLIIDDPSDSPYLKILSDGIISTPGSTQSVVGIEAGLQTRAGVVGDELLVHACSHTNGTGGDLRIAGGFSFTGAHGAVRIGHFTPGPIYLERGFFVGATAAEPEADEASKGQVWYRSSDKKPMFTDEDGTAYDLTAGVSAGVSAFNTRTGDVTPASGDYTAAMVSAAPDTHVGAGGAAHADATGSASGFMSSSDKIQLSDLVNQAIRDIDFARTDPSFLFRTGAGTYTAIKALLSGSAPPDSSYDGAAGYSPGSRVVDITNDEEWVCVDSSTGAAIWKSTTESLTTLEELTDTAITSPQDTEILSYDDATSKWVNVSRANLGMTAYVQTADPAVGGSPADGDFWIQTP